MWNDEEEEKAQSDPSRGSQPPWTGKKSLNQVLKIEWAARSGGQQALLCQLLDMALGLHYVNISHFLLDKRADPNGAGSVRPLTRALKAKCTYCVDEEGRIPLL